MARLCPQHVLPGTCANVSLVPLIGTPHLSWSLAAAVPPADLAPINVTPTLREAVHQQWPCQGNWGMMERCDDSFSLAEARRCRRRVRFAAGR